MKWLDEERLLTLDLYLRKGLLEENSEDLKKLYSFFNSKFSENNSERRTIDSIKLKLANFAALDPSHPGKGMENYSKQDEALWNKYASDEDTLSEIVKTIFSGIEFKAESTSVEKKTLVKDIISSSVRSYQVSIDRDLYYANKKEHQLVVEFSEYLRSLGHKTEYHIYPQIGKLSCDLFDVTKNVLYEAKADCKRESIRMAVGQLFDYKRFEQSSTILSILLPHKPSDDLISYLDTLNIQCTYKTKDKRIS